MRSLMVVFGRKALLMYCSELVFGVGIGMCQSFVVGERCPVMMVLLLDWMDTLSLVKWAVHPWSQSWLMDSKECWRSGKTKACCASGDNVGCSWMVVLWLDVMLEPSGSCTSMVVSGCVVVVGVDDWMKW